jgi:hypothetical protein
MKFIDKVKRIFFTDSDLGIKSLDPDFKEKMANERVIQDGAQSQLLMSSPIFQQVVAEMYLNLDAQLDFVEDTDPGAAEQIRWLRVQRRGLRQICAILDNKIAGMEQLNNALKENQDES